jgi:hypothetical protein
MDSSDDLSIPNTSTLARGVRVPDWIAVEDGRERLNTATFLGGANMEASCFVLEEVGGIKGFCEFILPKLEAELRMKLRFATIPASAVRSLELWLSRRPREFENNPAHVVVCAPSGLSKNQYTKRVRKLAAMATLYP